MCQTDKMEQVEVTAIIRYLCKKGMSPKEIYEDFIENLEKESPSHSAVKKWAAEFRSGERERERERVLKMMNGLGAPKRLQHKKR